MNTTQKEKTIAKEAIKRVYEELQNRVLHPRGDFDSAGRFFLADAELVNVRNPSRSWPYSQMHAGRTLKFVKKIAEKYGCTSYEDLKACFKGN